MTFIKKHEGKYSDLPEGVRNKITEDEFKTLVELQDEFIHAIGYVDYALRDDDFDTNFGYIVHDWLGDSGYESNRNDVVLRQLRELAEAKDRIEKTKYLEN